MSSSAPILHQNGTSPDQLESPSTREDLRPDQRLYLQMCRAIDTPLAAVLLLVSFLAMNVGRTSAGFDDFLALRITFKNLLMVVGFAVAWRLASSGWGLYAARAVKSRWKESFRVAG